MQINLNTIKYATSLAICHSSSCHRCREVFKTEACPRDDADYEEMSKEMIDLYLKMCQIYADVDSVNISDEELKSLLEM